MKKTVLILLLLVVWVSNGQVETSDIQIFAITGNFGYPGSAQLDGEQQRSYERFGAVSTFTQATSGPDQTWDISGLTGTNTHIGYYNTVPTAEELLLYPGTYMVTTGNISNNTSWSIDSKSYLSYGSGPMDSDIRFTGVIDTELTLNYATNNASIGISPLIYGYAHSDTVSGTFISGTYTGTFEGTLVTSVDAYGDMTFNPFESFGVMRMKTVENLQFSSPSGEIVGTYLQTTYRYYRAQDSWPYVKSTNRVINAPTLNLNTNVTHNEKANAAFLSINNAENEQTISLYPNPATNIINVSSTQEIVSLAVVDQLGKVVLTKNKSSNLDVSTLQSVIYFIKISSINGSCAKKFLKN